MKPLFKSKISLWASVLALVVVIGVGATLALMSSSSNAVTNSFTAADIDTEIEEVLTNGDKQVSIKNYGPSDAYVRARIMVSGVNPENVVIASEEPAEGAVDANTVYLVMTNPNLWVQEEGAAKDDFYYYLGVLAKDQKSANLLDKVVLGDKLAADKDFLDTFSVTIYHESVLAINKPAKVDINTVKDSFEAAALSTATTPTP